MNDRALGVIPVPALGAWWDTQDTVAGFATIFAFPVVTSSELGVYFAEGA